MDVTLATSVDEFFHEVVTDALSVVDLDASEPASWYLVGLLGEMTRARLTDEPLGVKLAQATMSEPGEQVRNLKHIGDTSLYVAGFFAESLSRSHATEAKRPACGVRSGRRDCCRAGQVRSCEWHAPSSFRADGRAPSVLSLPGSRPINRR